MSETLLLRLGILVAGLILIAGIWWASQRPARSPQGQRRGERGERSEPSLGDAVRADLDGDEATPTAQASAEQAELGLDAPTNELGKRREEEFDRIVTLFVAARANQTLRGPDILVAAEKAGLVFGHMDVFHRLVDRRPEAGPIFSVANIIKPGSFDMASLQSLETPAIAFFLTLPAPVGALEAWDTMLPAAQRMAELLDGVVLDEERNALGRQRIAHIRDELRAWDRQREAAPLAGPGRW
ncbi:cell division protein ZipA [Luteimonas sp. e5]